MNEAANDNATAETKPRKVRTPKEKAPSRKENPAGYQAHYLTAALANVDKRATQTAGWGVEGLDGHLRDARFSLAAALGALKTVPADFKAPRKRGGGGGRKAKTFVAGQKVTLGEKAMAQVQQVFPDVAADCDFYIYPKMIISENTKLYSVECRGVGSALPGFYVGFFEAKHLTPVE